MRSKIPASNEHPVSKTRLCIVVANPLVRRGLLRLVSQNSDLEVCGETGGARDWFADLIRLQPDVVIADINLKG